MARGDDDGRRAAELAFRAELGQTKESWADAVDREARMKRLLEDPVNADLAAKYHAIRRN